MLVSKQDVQRKAGCQVRTGFIYASYMLLTGFGSFGIIRTSALPRHDTRVFNDSPLMFCYPNV